VRVIGFPVGIGVTAKEMGMDNRDPVNHMIMREKGDTSVIAQKQS
jgi:hypothetical protein